MPKLTKIYDEQKIVDEHGEAGPDGQVLPVEAHFVHIFHIRSMLSRS